MKVAAIQFCPTPNDYACNLRRLAQMVVEIAPQVDLVVCPELALCQYALSSVEEARRFAERFEEAETPHSGSVMAAIARKFNTHIVWGFVEEDRNGCLYNSQALVSPDGNRISYAKVNLFGPDNLWCHAGSSNPPIHTATLRDGTTKRIGLLVCRDVRDKSAKIDSFYEKGEADVVCLSAAWGSGTFPAVAWMDFVKDNDMTLVVSNRYGDEGTRPERFGGGGVCIIKPEGDEAHPNGVYCDGVLWNQDCVVIAEV